MISQASDSWAAGELVDVWARGGALFSANHSPLMLRGRGAVAG